MLTLVGIIGCLSLFFTIIAIIVLVFSRQITKPIGALTRFTKDLKQAENKKAKEEVIQQVKRDDNFKDINEQYEEYQRRLRKRIKVSKDQKAQ